MFSARGRQPFFEVERPKLCIQVGILEKKIRGQEHMRTIQESSLDLLWASPPKQSINVCSHRTVLLVQGRGAP